MTCRAPIVFVLVLTLAALRPDAALAAAAVAPHRSPAAVVAEQTRHDGEVVTIRGEAIGEALRADGDNVWVNVLGDGLALGVVVPRAVASAVRTYGDYGHRGDEVQVTGVFSISCDVHPGETDVHASEFSVVRRGRPLEHPVSWAKLAIGLAAMAFAALLGTRYRRREHAVPSAH